MENRESAGNRNIVAYAVIAVVVLGATAALIYQMGPDAMGMGESRTSAEAPMAPPLDVDLSALMKQAGHTEPSGPFLITPGSQVTVVEAARSGKGSGWKALFETAKSLGSDAAPPPATPVALKAEAPKSAKPPRPSKTPASNKRRDTSSHASADR